VGGPGRSLAGATPACPGGAAACLADALRVVL